MSPEFTRAGLLDALEEFGQRHLPARQPACQHLDIVDAYGGVVTPVDSVEVRLTMLVMEHADNDAVEATEFRLT